MKKNELKTLKTLIRGIVREEVEFALKKELTEVFKSLKKKPITERKRIVRKKQPLQQLAKDPVLNKILNETRGGVPTETDGQEEYPTMGGKTFDRTSMASLMGYGNQGGGSDRAEQTIQQMGVPSEAVPEDVKNALTKDYSAVMKAIDKKKTGGIK